MDRSGLPALLARHLGPRAPRFRQPDGDGLLATRHLLAGAAALELAALALVHRALHLLLRFLSVPGHMSPWVFANRKVAGTALLQSGVSNLATAPLLRCRGLRRARLPSPCRAFR